MYWRNENSYSVQGVSYLLFDGKTRNDAAGRQRKFEDINKDKTYTMQAPIALDLLSSSKKKGYQCIEDDWITAKHYQVENSAYPFEAIWNCKVWREDLNKTRWETLLFFTFGPAPSYAPRGNDDIYDEGGFYGFTKDNTSTGAWWRPNDDMDMELYQE